MVARALDDRFRARVSHAEPLAADAADEDLAARGPVGHDVARDHVVFRPEEGVGHRPHDHAAAGEALAAVVVDVADDRHLDAGHAEGHQALAGRAGERDPDRAVGQAARAVPTRDLARKDGADRAVDVADRQVELDRLLLLEGRLAEAEERGHVERPLDAVILRLLMVRLHVLRHLRLVEDRREVEPLRLPVGDGGPGIEPVHPADHLVDRAEAELRHQLAKLLGEHEEEVDDVLRLAGELLAELRILRGDAHRAGVQVALPHHDAADHHERRRGDAVFLGAQERGDGHVLGGADHAVGLHHDPAAEVVHHEHLVGLGEAEFPGQAAVHDRGLGARARAAVVARDEHHVGLALRHARRHGPHAHLGHELHAHAGMVVGVLEVVDQLGEILDRVDVVVRWRRDQPHARCAVPNPRDLAVHLVAGELASLAGLRALGHLDLQFLGMHEIGARHAEAAAGHLLDLRVLAVAVGLELVADGVFAPFARVAPAAETVHRHGERLVGLLRDRAVRHGAGRKPLHDLLGRLHLVERKRRLGERKVEQTAQGEKLRLLLVDQSLILPELLAAVDLRGSLQAGDHLGGHDVGLTLPPPRIAAAHIELERLRHVRAGPGVFVPGEGLVGEAFQADAADAAGRPREELVHERLLQAHRLEDLRAAVALLRGDAHLAHDLQQALRRRLDEVLVELLPRIVAADDLLRLHLVDRGEGDVGVHGAGAVTGEQREVLHLAGLARFDDEPATGAGALADEVVVHAGSGQERRHGGLVAAHAAVGEHEDRRAALHGLRRLGPDRIETLPHPRSPVGRWKEHRDRLRDEAGPGRGVGRAEGLDPGALGVRDHGSLEPQEPGLLGLRIEQVPLAADRGDHRGDDLLADRVERRVGHLGEELLEVVGQELRPVGEHGQRRVVAHRADRLGAVGGHRREDHLQVFERVAEGPLEFEQARVLSGDSGGPPRVDGVRSAVAIRRLAVAVRARQQRRGGLHGP